MFVPSREFLCYAMFPQFDALVLLHLASTEDDKRVLIENLEKLRPDALVVVVNGHTASQRCTTWQGIQAERFPGFITREIPDADIPAELHGADLNGMHLFLDAWLEREELLIQGTSM